MKGDPLFRDIEDPIERTQMLVSNAEKVVEDLKQVALERCEGVAVRDVFNLSQYLGNVIREIADLQRNG